MVLPAQIALNGLGLRLSARCFSRLWYDRTNTTERQPDSHLGEKARG